MDDEGVVVADRRSRSGPHTEIHARRTPAAARERDALLHALERAATPENRRARRARLPDTAAVITSRIRSLSPGAAFALCASASASRRRDERRSGAPQPAVLGHAARTAVRPIGAVSLDRCVAAAPGGGRRRPRPQPAHAAWAKSIHVPSVRNRSPTIRALTARARLRARPLTRVVFVAGCAHP